MNAVRWPKAPPKRPKLALVRATKRPTIRPAAIVVVIGIFATVVINAMLVGDGFKLSALEKGVKQAEEQNLMLRAQIAELGSPSRLNEVSQQEGLVVDPAPVGLAAASELRPQRAAGEVASPSNGDASSSEALASPQRRPTSKGSDGSR